MRTNSRNGVPKRTVKSVQRSMVRFAVAAAAALMLPPSLPGQNAKAPQNNNAATAKAERGKPNFDRVGPQVGDQLPDLHLRTMKGEPQRLRDAWRGGAALLVTSSLTCPKSRSRWPELKAIVEKYGEKLNVVIVYVIEAHPVGSVCPYKGIEDVTPENEHDGILRRQPTTQEERLELAQEFKRYLRVNTPIYVDTVDNQAWKAFGAAPNIAMLVDTDGIVAAREGWFDGKAMQETIDKYLIAAGRSAPNERLSARMGHDEEMAATTLLKKAGLDSYEMTSAIRNKNTASLAKILKQTRALANCVFPIGRGHNEEATALMEAVKYRNVAAAELLLSYGADVNGRTNSLGSALQCAAQTDDLEMTKLLLGHHADPRFPRTGKSPLHEAALAGHQEVAKMLIAAGAQKDFYSEIAFGNIGAVRELLLADPSLALRPDGAGRMPMDYAAANGRVDIANLLLAGGAPVVDDLRSSIDPPLHRAIDRADVRMVKLLLDAGSSPDTAVGDGEDGQSWMPALHRAVSVGNVEIVRQLAHKANLSARNTFSQTALHVAAEMASAEIAEVLIRAGADVNAPQLQFNLPCGSGEEETPSQNTPLHFAAARGNPPTIKVLLEGGAKLEARNVKGETPLMSTVKPPLYTGIAKESQLKNVATLIAAGADVNARDNEGQTILGAALVELNSGQSGNDRRREWQNLPNLIDLLKKHGAKQGAPKAKE